MTEAERENAQLRIENKQLRESVRNALARLRATESALNRAEAPRCAVV